MNVYLYVNALLYAIFAVLCTVKPWGTAAGVGYTGLTAGGRSEYLVVYGGMQFGLAAVFAVLARADLATQRLGMLLSLCLYAPIVVYRVGTVVRYWPVGGMTLAIGLLEVVLLLAALTLYLRTA